MTKNQLVHIKNAIRFPGRSEFDCINENIPSVMIYPLRLKGVVILGGSSERCFNSKDEKWFIGWTEKLYNHLTNRDNI